MNTELDALILKIGKLYLDTAFIEQNYLYDQKKIKWLSIAIVVIVKIFKKLQAMVFAWDMIIGLKAIMVVNVMVGKV